MKSVKFLVFFVFLLAVAEIRAVGSVSWWVAFLVAAAGGGAIGWMFKMIEDKKGKK